MIGRLERVKKVWRAPQEVDRLKQEQDRLKQELAEAYDRIAWQKHLTKRLQETKTWGVRPENVVWIFGTGRSGNTWLTAMMEEAGHAVWKEPAIGKLFGEFYYGARESQRANPKFVLSDVRKDVWLGSLRLFVLEGASGRFPQLSDDECLVVKEQPGSVGAPLLMEALPESRMILLIRDPRDVVASWLDGSRSGGWHHANVVRKRPERTPKADENPTRYVKGLAKHYLKNVGKAAEAYDAHVGPKVLVRYEELRADTLGTMKRIYTTLGIAVNEKELARIVHKHSWENIPEDEKGEGKFRRKAMPGSWKEDLTPEQAETVERITTPLLDEFYPGWEDSRSAATRARE